MQQLCTPASDTFVAITAITQMNAFFKLDSKIKQVLESLCSCKMGSLSSSQMFVQMLRKLYEVQNTHVKDIFWGITNLLPIMAWSNQAIQKNNMCLGY